MKRALTKFGIGLLTLVPLLQASTPTHADSGPVGGAPSGTFAAAGQSSSDIPSLRSRTSRTFVTDGHYETQISQTSVNYQDAQGRYQPIDNSLVPAQNTQYAYQNKANRYTVDFPSTLGSQSVHVQLGSGWVEFAPVGITATGTVSGATDTYSFSGGSFAFTAQPDQLKESISLTGPSSPSTFSYTLNASTGLSFQSTSQGGISVVGATGKALFGIMPPSMTDAAGATSAAVHFSLAPAGASAVLTVTADSTWLSDPARQWPVVIDPTVTLSSAVGCTLNSYSPTKSVCAGPSWAEIGTNGGATKYRFVSSFNLSSIPAGATVLHATLGVKFYADTTSQPVGLYQLNQNFATGATWNTYDGTHAWATPGGDFASTPVSTNPDVSKPTATRDGSYDYWYPTPLVAGWVNGTIPNDGVMLKQVGETTSALLEFYPAGSTYSPTLTVDYDYQIGSQSFYATVSQTVDDHMGYDVNVATGNLLVSANDLNMPEPGIPLQVGRYYNSLTGALGGSSGSPVSDLGGGWLLNTGTDTGLMIFPDGSVAYQAPSGYQIAFTKNSDGSFTSPPAINSTLVQNADKTYTLTSHDDGSTMTFSSGGYLTKEADASGNTMTFSYMTNPTAPNGPSQLLTKITDTQGRTTSFTYVDNQGWDQLQSITDPAGRTYTYGYDASHDLISYTDPAGAETKFTYTGNYLLSSLTDPDGNVTTFAYDSQNRVTSVSQPANSSGQHPVTTYSYSAGQTVVTDPDGNPSTYFYDLQGRVGETQDAAGHTSYTAWNLDDQVDAVQNPSGATASASYDTGSTPSAATNDLLSTTDGYGNTASSYSYSDPSHPYLPTASSTPSPAGGMTSTTATYNADGTPQQTTTGGNGPTTSYTYTSNGSPATISSSTGDTLSMTYDPTTGLPSTITPAAPLGQVTAYYTAAGELDHTVNAQGAVTQYGYDADGRVTGISYADGMTKGYAYDKDGNVLAVSVQASATSSDQTESFTYDADGNQTQENQPGGRTVSWTYDLAGNKTSMTDPTGTTNWGYNHLGQVTSVSSSIQPQPVSISYNPDGTVAKKTFPDGRYETYTYDSDGRMTACATYDASGNIVSGQRFTYLPTSPVMAPTTVTNADGTTTTFTYGGTGSQVTSEITKDANGNVIHSKSFTYNNGGQMTSETIDGATSTFTYFPDGQLDTINGVQQYYDTSGHPANPPGQYNSFIYNDAGQLTGGLNADGSITPLSYCGPNMDQVCTDGSNNNWQYDGGNPVSVTQNGTTYLYTTLPDGTVVSQNANGSTDYVLGTGTNTVGLIDPLGNVGYNCQYDPVTGHSMCINGSLSTPLGPAGWTNVPAPAPPPPAGSPPPSNPAPADDTGSCGLVQTPSSLDNTCSGVGSGSGTISPVSTPVPSGLSGHLLAHAPGGSCTKEAWGGHHGGFLIGYWSVSFNRCALNLLRGRLGSR